MKLKNHFCTSVKDFISTMEELEVDLDRGQHETSILAANILRRGLQMGLPEGLWIGTEINVKSWQSDLIILGENSSGALCAYVLEFKQWSKVEVETPGFSTRKWGEKDTNFELTKEGSPLLQTEKYHDCLMNSVCFDTTTTRSALVLPNLEKSNGTEFIDAFNSECKTRKPSGAFCLETLSDLVDDLVGYFLDGVGSNSERYLRRHFTKDSFTKKTKVVNENIKMPTFIPCDVGSNSSKPVTVSVERHGWVGDAEAFIAACVENTLLRDFSIELGLSERRNVLFSSNHLAFALRKTQHKHPNLFKQLGVIIEFGLGFDGKRIDAVLVRSKSKKRPNVQFLAIEMKAWSKRFMDSQNGFEPILQSLGSDTLPSKFKYFAKGGKSNTSKHPVYQVIEYIDDLRSEFDLDIHGLAWLHNVQLRLDGNLKNLYLKDHIQLGQKHTVFKPSNYKKDLSLLTRNFEYPKKVENTLDCYIFDHFGNESLSDCPEMNEQTLESVSGAPKLSNFAVEQAYDNADYIIKQIFNPEQKKIAMEIIDAAEEAIKLRDRGQVPKKAVFCIEGDAGTGKTFVALAAIGKVIKFLADMKNTDNLPHLVSLSTAASDMLSTRCTIDKKGYNVHKHFVVSRQNFNSNSRFYLSNLRVKEHQGDNPPPLLFFDEAQLQPPSSKSMQNQLYPSRQNSSSPSNFDAEKQKFEKWAEMQNYRATNKDGKLGKVWQTNSKQLIGLADVTVFFIDSKQSTRSISHDNITRKSLEKEVNALPNTTWKYLQLTKAHRSGANFQQVLRTVLYGSKPPNYSGGTENFKVKLSSDLSGFLKDFQDLSKQSTSCGLVAGYTQEWKSKDGIDNTNYDWDFKNGGGSILKMHWNERPGREWISSPEVRKTQVGYFLAVQGNELDHVYVYIGDDLEAEKTAGDWKTNAIIENHRPESECISDTDVKQVKRECILNQYWVLLTRASKSCTIFIKDEELRSFFAHELKKAGY